VTVGRRATAAAVLLAAVVGGAIQWRQPLLPDSSWLLWVAGRWLNGARLYRDVFEVNPPLAIWLNAPIVWLAGIFDLQRATVFRVAVIAWCLGCTWLFDAVLRRTAMAPGRRHATIIAAAIVVLVLAGPFFGQREHLLLAAALPWTALIACRRTGADLPVALAAAVGLLVSLGIALKPTHLGLWLALPLLARRHRWWRFPEIWIVPASGLLYIGMVAGLTSYFEYLSEWGLAYWRFRHVSLLHAGAGNELALLAVGACAVGWHARRDPLTGALLVCTAASLLGAALQAKALPYHYWPADGLALVLLAVGSRITRYALVPVLMIWAARITEFAWDGASVMRRQMAELKVLLGGRHPLVLGRSDDAAWLLVSEAGEPWLSPHYCLWWLQLSGGRDTVPGLAGWARQDSILRLSVLPASPPDALLLETEGVDVMAYLQRTAEWRRLLEAYTPVGEAAGYRVLYRDAR
jgi:hypothetical protein